MRLKRLAAAAAVAALCTVGLAGMASTASAAPATDCTRFIATTGSDTAAGTSAAPWKTVLPSLNKLNPGAVLCIKAGTYTQEVVDSTLPDGTSTSRITVKAFDAATPPLLDGRFSLSGLSFWTIQNLRFTNPTPTTVSGGATTNIVDRRIVAFIGGNDVLFQNNEVFNGNYAGLLVGRASPTSSEVPTRYTIRGNFVHDTDAANFYFNPGRNATGHLIERNRFVRSGTENLKVGWGDDCDGITPTGTSGYGTGGVTVRYNTMVDAGSGGNFIVAEPGGLQDVRADHNLFYDPASERGFSVRYDSATATTAWPHGCLGDKVFVTDTWAYLTLPSGAVGTNFSEDFGDSPANVSHEARITFGQDPKLDANFVPTVAAAQAYGYRAP